MSLQTNQVNQCFDSFAVVPTKTIDSLLTNLSRFKLPDSLYSCLIAPTNWNVSIASFRRARPCEDKSPETKEKQPADPKTSAKKKQTKKSKGSTITDPGADAEHSTGPPSSGAASSTQANSTSPNRVAVTCMRSISQGVRNFEDLQFCSPPTCESIGPVGNKG